MQLGTDDAVAVCEAHQSRVGAAHLELLTYRISAQSMLLSRSAWTVIEPCYVQLRLLLAKAPFAQG